MPNPTPGQHGRPDEPQCYNCGLVGHWAVACPEPTRATPAGLAAWRSSSNPSSSHIKGHGYNPNKRSKGPIITKYAPPPSQYPPVMGHVPPPPGHHSHQQPPPPPSSYPGQPSSYHSYTPPPPPPPPPSLPAYAGNFPPPPYGYPHAQYSSPPPPPGYRGPPPGPPPPVNPPTGGHFPHSRVDGQDHRQQSHHNHGFSRSPPPPHPPHPSPPSRSSSQKRSESRPNLGPLKPLGLPPKPPAGIVSHPLPPKPPKSHDQINQHQDHRNKRKNDRHNKGRDRRQSNDHNNQRKSNHGHPRNGQCQLSPENRRSSGSKRGHRQSHGGTNAKKQHTTVAASDKPSAGSKGHDGGRRLSSEQPAPLAFSPEAIDHKLEDIETVPGIASPRPQGIETYANDATPRGRDNEKASEPSNPYASVENLEDSDRPSLSDYHGSSSKHSCEQDDKHSQRQAKRPRIEDSPKEEKNRSQIGDGEECLWNTIDVPREVDRRQQVDRDAATRRRESGGSRASRHSSPSNQSSDLNSLEAELLGRPVKQKSPEKPSLRHRGEQLDVNRLKPKRRRANTNSAYR